jgi:hypothetical protein
LGIGTSTPNVPLEVNGNVRFTQSGSTTFGVNIATTGGATTITPISSTSNITLISQNSNSYLSLAPSSVALVSRGGNLFVNALNVLAFETGASSTERARFATTTGNFLINTTTDAGYKLDVNGTARVKGAGATSVTSALTIQNSAGTEHFRVQDDGVLFVRSSTATRTGSAGSDYYLDLGNIVVRNGNGTAASTMSIGKSTVSVASSIFELVSTTKGFLPPRMTTTEKNAIATPAAGLVVYDSTLNKLCVRTASAWETITSL